jgi:hypothetical protein
MPEALHCPACKREIDVSAFVENCRSYFATTHTVSFRCPLCEKTTDARIERGRILLGYIYAAGAPHFCGMIEIPVANIDVDRSDGGIAIVLGERRFEVAAVTPRN